MFNYVRRKVSLNKNRYQQDGFDLDLTYITKNVAAMGFPAIGVEALYRNPRTEVKRLLDKQHKDHYKVYNLCVEPKWKYEPVEFENRVSHYPFADHNAPPLPLMTEFCKDVEEWLAKDQDNVVAVHCKAGKGRAGMMICCWLQHSKTCSTADEAMQQYGAIRTKDGKGVTIPSQRRYVKYYEKILKYGLPEPRTIKLKTITVRTTRYAKQESEMSLQILEEGKTELLVSAQQSVPSGQDFVLDTNKLAIKGDIKINFYDKSFKDKKGKASYHIWFNTAFISGNQLVIKKPEIDNAWKDKKNKKFLPDFEIVLTFSGARTSPMDGNKSGEKDKSGEKSKTESKKSPKSRSKKSKKSKKASHKDQDSKPTEEKKEAPKAVEPSQPPVKGEEKPVESVPPAKSEEGSSKKPETESIVSPTERKGDTPSPITLKDDEDVVVVIQNKPKGDEDEEESSSSSDEKSSDEEAVEQPAPEKKPEVSKEPVKTARIESESDSESSSSEEESSEDSTSSEAKN